MRLLTPTLIILLLLTSSLYPQEQYFGKENYTVHKVFLLIDGATKAGALRSFLNIEEGQEFENLEELTQALEEEKQALIDRKYYTKVDYILEGNPKIGYIVTFLVEEETPLDTIPFQIYNKRSRRETGDEGIYDNAFGTMTDWDLSLYAQVNSGGVVDWQVRQRVRKLRIGRRIFAFYVSQHHDNIFFEEFGSVLGDYSVDRTQAGFSTEIPLENDLTYETAPSAVVRYNYTDKGGAGEYNEIPFELRLDHNIYRELIEWKGNGREGYKTEIFNTIRFAQTLSSDTGWDNSTSIGLSGSIYLVPWRYISLYSNVIMEYGFGKNTPMQGDKLRGILDYHVYGNKSLFFRNTLGLDLLRAPDLINLQIHPFIDLGTSSSQGNPFHTLYTGVGIDSILFMDFASNFTIRVSTGMNLGKYLEEKTQEWEVTIQTGLAY